MILYRAVHHFHSFQVPHQHQNPLEVLEIQVFQDTQGARQFQVGLVVQAHRAGQVLQLAMEEYEFVRELQDVDMVVLSSLNTDVYLTRVLGLLRLHKYNKDNTNIGLLLHIIDRQGIGYQSGDIPSGLDVTCRASLRA
uniref:Uncharacterized protein n=1 Tax=Heterorhabditis bacteriophora TaxID=37862 RepID=A0A1I7WEQ6_HETBA